MLGKSREYLCGDFSFQFHIFDFSRGIEGRYVLHQSEKNLLKEHRIYLYRDGVRVYPYGDSDDDWLNIDVTRGTGRAGNFFSNDQIIGWVDITQADNPNASRQDQSGGFDRNWWCGGGFRVCDPDISIIREARAVLTIPGEAGSEEQDQGCSRGLGWPTIWPR